MDDARALTDKRLAHPVQHLQVELVGRFGCDELHRGALHRLGGSRYLRAMRCIGLLGDCRPPVRQSAHDRAAGSDDAA
jgi:hypothetical protein